MSYKYEHLMSPLKIGSITVKNRYAVGGMGGRHLIYNDKGAYNDNGIDYWVNRARGGFGLIVTGSNVANLTVDPWDPKNGNPNPATFPSYFGAAAAKTLEGVHAHGGKMFMQVSMGPGRMRDGKSCSPIPRYKQPDQLTEELTVEEIHEKVADMVKLAKLAKGWGYDGVEIHGMHWGYLLDQFAMAYTNHRTDEYGGDLDGRLRIHKEIVRGIKEACGEDFPVSFRMCIKTFMGGYNKTDLTGEHDVGRDIDESVEIAKRFESWGVDMLNVNTGTYDTFYYCVSPYYLPKGYNIKYARQIKEAVSIPVFVAGGMDDPDICEEALAQGWIDGVTLARASLVDPFYPQKVAQGRVEDIRPCMRCTNCIESNLANGIPLCSANPAAMRELSYGVPKAPVSKKVVVVGGGVAGMQAALTACEAGHEVSLYEASGVLGGHLNEAGSHPFKFGIHDLNLWYQRQLEKLGIPVYLNSPMDAEKIKALKPDVAILSVGSYHFIPPIPGHDHEKSVLCYDVLMGQVKPGQKVVVVGGGLTGSELAYDLAAYEGRDVTVVEGLPDILSAGAPVQKSVNMMLRDLLAHHKVKLVTNTFISAVSDEGAVVLDRATDKKYTIEADTVIFAIGLKPNKSLAQELLGSGIEVHEVGDGKQVANIRVSTSEAYEVARKL